MTSRLVFRWPLSATAALLLGSAAALAQPPRPSPLDAAASAPPLRHRSALQDYRAQPASVPPLAWRDANDAVERIGGWRAYAREAQAASAPAPAASAHRR